MSAKIIADPCVPRRKIAGGHNTATATHESTLVFTEDKKDLVREELMLTTTKTETRVDSRILARQLGVEARASFALIKRYAETFKSFGQLTFKKAVGERRQSGGYAERFAMLNEDQAYFLLSLSRNNKRVVEVKAQLIRAFGDARKANELRRTEYLPGHHALHDAIHIRAAGSSTEQFVHANINKLLNNVAGIEPGQRATASLPTLAMLVVAQMMAAQAMRVAPNTREGFRLAKVALAPLQALTARLALGLAI